MFPAELRIPPHATIVAAECAGEHFIPTDDIDAAQVVGVTGRAGKTSFLFAYTIEPNRDVSRDDILRAAAAIPCLVVVEWQSQLQLLALAESFTSNSEAEHYDQAEAVFDNYLAAKLREQFGPNVKAPAIGVGPAILKGAKVLVRSKARLKPADVQDDIVNLLDMPEESRPEPVVHNVIDRGEVFIVTAGPKVAKSFFAHQLALSIAAATRFLCWDTTQGRVLIVDNELKRWQITARLREIAKAMGLEYETIAGQIDVWSLRGSPRDINSIRRRLAKQRGKYACIICDAMYKVYPEDCDENSNSNMMRFFTTAEQIAEETGSSFGFIHHTSKGDQSKKKVSDVGAGAGSMIRAADVQLVLRELAEEGVFGLQGLVRSHPRINPVALTFDYPLWQLAPDVDPHDRAKPGQVPPLTLSAFVEFLSEDFERLSEVIPAARRALGAGATESAIKALIREGRQRGLLETTRLKGTGSPQAIRRLKRAA